MNQTETVAFTSGVFTFKPFWQKGILAGFSANNFSGQKLEAEIDEILSRFSLKAEKIIFARQVHGPEIVKAEDNLDCIPSADGLISANLYWLLAIRTADCLPLFLFHERKNFIALLHLGWKPIYRGILESLQRQIEAQNLEPKYLWAGLGPALRKCCFAVGEEFLSYGIFSPYLRRKSGQLWLDMIELVKDFLVQMGIEKVKIIDAGFCSFCRQDLFYSYRGQETAKRTISFIMRVNKKGG